MSPDVTLYAEYHPSYRGVVLHNGDVMCEAAREGRVHAVRVVSLIKWVALRGGVVEECVACWPTATAFREVYPHAYPS